MKNKELFGSFLLLLTAMIWGLAFVAQRVGMDYIGPFTFGAARYFLSFLFIVGVTLISKRKNLASIKKDLNKESIISGIICGALLFLGTTFQQFGILYSTASKAGFITAMYIVLVPIISFLFFRQRPSLKSLISVIIAIIGFYFLSIKTDLSIGKGEFILFLGAISWAVHITSVGKFVKDKDILIMLNIQFFITFIFSLIAAILTETINLSSFIDSAVPTLYSGIFSGGVCFTFQMIAQKYTEATTASLLMSLESVFAVIAGSLILGEVLNSRELIGCIIIFIAILISQIRIKTLFKI